MKTTEHIHDFLEAFVNWASARKDVQGIALGGSHATGTARDVSDLDLVLLTAEPQMDRPLRRGREISDRR